MAAMLRANCLIVGDEAVGKSAVGQVFQSDNCQFQKNYIMTTSLEILSKIILLPELHINLEIFLMSTSGKELFYEMNARQLSDPDMAVIVHDVTNEESIKSVTRWAERIRSLRNSGDIPIILVGNKIDLEEQRRISSDMGGQMAQSMGMHYMECSARNMQNVTEIFQYLAQQHCSSKNLIE